MSAPISSLIPGAVLLASLLGSAHCAAMCGVIMISAGRTPGAVARYHAGRLAGYLVLGALAGWVGKSVFNPAWFSWVAWIATGAMALVFVIMAIRMWGGKLPHLNLVSPAVSRFLFRLAQGRPLLVGLATAALPCGWLHGFVLGAAATRSPVSGALFLLAFWLGTLPALTSFSMLLRHPRFPKFRAWPRTSAALLIVAAMLSLSLRMSPVFRRPALVATPASGPGTANLPVTPGAADPQAAPCPFHAHL